ncbi:hypothetical protein A9P98_13560 [Cylindrospermopsis raciborskii CS-505]|uniref:Carbohydrate-binding/sugar hydrolysis domain-containing protein n=1 Tax=Cylindrospermopsis raciborskii CS-505 TaxID=533240 RepID=A0A853MJB7_9CYAN|nr:hypothetical protein A9P98_13560 [Cylindrospermopsis raciborskii CS-505]
MDPISGVNIVSTGNSVTNPYKTITFALEQAQPGTIIQLAPGSYTNESFPIILKQGITLRGDESTKGKTVVISGGGDYNSRSFARQNVTILAEQDSTINGVTVTNRNARGTGVWVESTNPVIKNSTFAQSLREGIFVTAGGDPTVENNQFTANNGNGISITKSSKGKISNNVIEKSGFGLSINHDSKPVLTKNQITNNRDGIVITDSAQPLLRSNVVKDNERDGIVITLNSSPDLGTRSNPGGNVIVNNGRSNIYNVATTGVAISALGNTIDDSGILGEVEIDGIQITGNRKPVSSDDPNLALLIRKWQLTAVSCSSTPVIVIFIGNKQYCFSPQPDLTAKAYEYNPTTGTLRALRTGPRPTKPGNL